MHRVGITPAVKLLLMSTVKKNFHHGLTNFLDLVTPSSALAVCSMRNLHSTRPFYTSVNRTLSVPSEMFQKIWNKINIFNPSKYRILTLGSILYEEIADTINYDKFYKEFKMSDTFYSWFVITELHVWMLMVRCMAEGKNGQSLRNYIVQAMWDDVNKRSKYLATKENPVNPRTVKKQIVELSHQFNACIIAYDEGITDDDKVLAGAIWRRILHSECSDPEMLEKLVFYVRKQIYLLDKMSWEELLKKRSVMWLGLDLIKSN